MKNILLTISVLLATLVSTAQVTGPEQDCIGAIPLCGGLFHQSDTYTGLGAIDEIASNATCLINGEDNSVWYRIEVTSSGMLEFLIKPANPGDDYDFAIYNTTGDSCEGIVSGRLNPTRCSWAVTSGIPTGLSTGYTSTGAGPNGDTLLAPINASQGDVYYILVDNFTGVQDGYTLDFSASTAGFIDTSELKVISIPPSSYRATPYVVEFDMILNKPIYCLTTFTPQSILLVNSVYTTQVQSVKLVCSPGQASSNKLHVKLNPNTVTPIGTYTITLTGGSITDLCGNSIAQDTFIVEIVDLTVGLPEEPPQDLVSFQILPNPTNGQTEFRFENSDHADATLTIYDLAGKEVLISNHLIESTNLNLSNLPKGTYLAALNSNGSRAFQKLVIY